MLRLFLADILNYLHKVLILVIVSPFLLPPGEWLKYVIILIPCIILTWHDGNSECDLTALEQRLRHAWISDKDKKNVAPFFQKTLNTCLHPLDRHISQENAYNFNYILFLVSIIVAFVQYCFYKKISFKPNSIIDKAMVSIICSLIILSGVSYILTTYNYGVRK